VRRLACAALVLLSPACGDAPSSPTTTACAGPYPDQAISAYILPWTVGSAFPVGQGNCGPGSHAAGTLVQYAYDLLMPVGTPILAAREGRVLLVEDRFADATRRPGEENYVNVRHDDGTIAGYVHLTAGGARVEVGQHVAQGQVIGLSGDSGSSTQPHLHFHVQGCDGCSTVPVTFRNARPHPRGLLEGESYRAEPF
jgi:murein DD-endopeptidase MepM/ murein hydrolase activator NlpD